MPSKILTRRRFLAGLGAGAAVSLAGGAEALWWEPYRVVVRELKFSIPSTTRFLVWSDFHYRGEHDYAEEVIEKINALRPEFVVFLGDLVDDRQFYPAALEFVKKIRFPVYGVPGNHDWACGAPMTKYDQAFRTTGGQWLNNQIVVPPGGKVELCGSSELYTGFVKGITTRPRILLTHYPMTVAHTYGKTFSAIFAGHSHGGQVRIPFYGAVYVPRHVGRYQLGLFDTPAGALYVNAGIGTYKLPARFNCPPELTVVEI